MGLLAWIVVGAIAGFLANQLMGSREGLIGMIVLGIVGGLVAGYLAATVFTARTHQVNGLSVNGLKRYVDGKSIPLLQGSEIDYVDALMGAGFSVNNPNAVAACGCGSSFRTADATGTARSCAR